MVHKFELLFRFIRVHRKTAPLFRRNCCEVRQVHRALKELAAARVNEELEREHIVQRRSSDSPQGSGRAPATESTYP